LKRVHEIKNDQGYNWDDNDTKFETTADVVKLASFCAIAAVLCGMTGIAGGMVLGPLFLSYNMLPQVMSGTNQYITMIASFSVAIQFFCSGQLNMKYAVMFGVLTLVSAFSGIHFVNKIIQKSGKQSIITVILTLVLVLALVSLPIDFIMKSRAAAAVAAGTNAISLPEW